MQTRRAYAELTYNGKNIKTALKDYATSFEYSDPAAEECDTVSISVADPDHRWIGAWIPTKGDQVTAAIHYENKDGSDSKRLKLDCGSFVLDEYSYSESGSGRALTISAISAPLDDAIKATERTKTWENVTIKQIGQEIAKRYSMSLVYDAQEITLPKQQQDKTTDSAFLQDICTKYGLMLKMYKQKIVIFDREAYKKKEAVSTISRAQMSSFSWKTTLTGTYTAAQIEYTDNKKNETHSKTIGSGKRILKVNDKAANDKDAELLATAALNNANHSMTTASFSTMGMPNLVAGQTVLITGFAKLSGKYYIDKKTDSLSGSGYVSNFEVSFVCKADKEIVNDSIDRLSSLGVISNAAYWKKSVDKMEPLKELFINAGTSIKTMTNSSLNSSSDYIAVLADRGIINSPDYWRKHLDYPYLKDLLQKIANAVI